MAIHIGSAHGYMRLDSWVLSKIIQLGTMSFCRRFLTYQTDPCRRQFDQTTMAARSVPANLAEGSTRHDTSRETELRLLDVSRGSINEVLDDFMFFLMDKGVCVWDESNPMAQQIRSIRLDTPVYDGVNLLHDVSAHILTQKQKFDPWIESEDMIVAANAIIVLCMRVNKMLHNQMNHRLEKFAAEGGFTENMTQLRIQSKKQQSLASGAPLCPRCGEVMMERTIKKGERAGKRFWGCPNYYKNGCEGVIPID